MPLWQTLLIIAGCCLGLWFFYELALARIHEAKADTRPPLLPAVRVENSPAVPTSGGLPALPMVFDERRIQSDLERVATNPSLVGQYLSAARMRFTHDREIAVLHKWEEFYKAGTGVLVARTEMARAAFTHQQIEGEAVIEERRKVVQIASLEADLEEQYLRAEEARVKREELRSPKPPPSPRPSARESAEEERRRKKQRLQDTLDRLRSDRDTEIKRLQSQNAGEADIRRLQNRYENKLRQAEEELDACL